MKLIFGRSFIFCTFVCNHGALFLRLHVVALPASVTMSWPAKTTWKLNRSRLGFLVLVLQNSNNFNQCFFQICFSFLLPGYMVHFVGVMCFLCFVFRGKTGIFDFFGLKSSNGYLMKPMFSEGLSFFVYVFNDGALTLIRHVVELSLSVTVSRAAESK